MKSMTLAWISAAIFCATLTSSFPAAAQSPAAQTPTTEYRYRAIDLGTLGGPDSAGCVPDCRYLSKLGTAIFNASTPKPDPFPPFCFWPGCFATHGVKFEGGHTSRGNRTTLSPLPGGVDTRPAWISDTNLVAGFSENGLLDPTTAAPEAIAVLWHGGFPTNLGTLGGNASNAWAVNSSGQVVGGATNATPDPLATGFYNLNPTPFPVSTEMHAFLWNQGVLQDLQTLGGPDSYARFINDGGQVAGISYTNSTPNPTTGYPTLDPFLWEHGQMKDLGSLGGTLGFVSGINNSGHIIGQSNLAGDVTYHPFVWQASQLMDLQTLGGDNGSAIWINDGGAVAGWADLPGSQVHHAFIWQNGVMTDLGTVGTDPCSTAYGMNSSGQVVGNSGDGSGIETCGPKLHGFLWEKGKPMVDLDTLFAPLTSGLRYIGACCISDNGEILGTAKLPNGDVHALLLIPCISGHADDAACYASPADVIGTAAIRTIPSSEGGAAAGATMKRNPQKPYSEEFRR